MEFKKYSSLENHYQQAFVNKIMMNGFAKPEIEWSVREKIHGANLSLWYDGSEIRVAKRTSFIGEFENFFEQHVIVKRYSENLKRLYKLLKVPEGGTMTVYGEIAGDMSTGRKVQKEVEYGALDFYAFDIKVNGVYINDLVLELKCHLAGIRTAPLIAVGKFEDMYKIQNDFQSLVFQQEQGVDPLKFTLVYEGDNVSEGFVLKPTDTLYMGCGTRVAIKSKNEKFSEKKKAQKIRKAKNIDLSLSEADAKVYEVIQEYITEARLRNVISKHGEVTQKHFGILMNMMVTDIVEDYEKEHEVVLAEVSENPPFVMKTLRSEVSNLIRVNFLQMINGMF